MAKSKNFDELPTEDNPAAAMSVEDRVAALEMRVEALEMVARRHNGGTSLERAQKELAAADTGNAQVEGAVDSEDNP